MMALAKSLQLARRWSVSRPRRVRSCSHIIGCKRHRRADDGAGPHALAVLRSMKSPGNARELRLSLDTVASLSQQSTATVVQQRESEAIQKDAGRGGAWRRTWAARSRAWA